MPLDCNEIIPNRLWIGRFVGPEEVRSLRHIDITTVFSLQSDEDLERYGISLKTLLKAYAEAGIELRRMLVNDFDKEDLLRNLPQCVAELEVALAPRWSRVYLHCTAGISRSPTVAAAYLIRSRGMTPKEAFEFVEARRHCSPYLDVLEQYATFLKGTP